LRRAAWEATNGAHEIEAIWDDIGRIDEANEANNTMTRRFTVRAVSPPSRRQPWLYLR
jgi:hypothetical protein